MVIKIYNNGFFLFAYAFCLSKSILVPKEVNMQGHNSKKLRVLSWTIFTLVNVYVALPVFTGIFGIS